MTLSLMPKNMDTLKILKKNVENSRNYSIRNFDRYHEFMRFVFLSSLTDQDIEKLGVLKKPAIEFNRGEAYLSRLRGEFAKHQPNLTVRATDGVRLEDLTPEFLETIDTVQFHMNEIFFNSNNDSLDYNIYSDILAGGFSVVHMYTDYVNNMSFEQVLKRERVFDPTMTGFDPLARESHKGDGAYCFQLIPKTKEDFEDEFGSAAAKNIKFARQGLSGFNWSYKNQDQEIMLLAEYYYKVKKKARIAKLSNGHVILKKHYEQFEALWNEQGFIEQIPIIIEERNSSIEEIKRVLFCEDKILDEQNTFYTMFPLIYIDGNSVMLKQHENGASEQVTRPYLFHAKGIQQLTNFAGQTVGAEIENLVQHKFIVAIEAIPEGYEDAYKNVQQASTLAYNAFYKNNPEVKLDPPREVNRTPTPPIVENIFMGTDRITQTILGTYDSVLATNDKQISGVGIQQGALQSNAAAIPYLMGYIKGLNRQAEFALDVLPKIYVTPRSIPIRKADGKRDYQIINKTSDPLSVDFNYNPNSLQVKVEAGVSSAIQKQLALEQITALSSAIPVVGEFIQEYGLETVIDNMDLKNVDHLKAQAEIFMKEVKERRMQAAEQGDPQTNMAKMQVEALSQIEMAKIEQQTMKAEGDHSIAVARVAVEKQKADTQFAALMAQVEQNVRKMDIEEEKVASEDARTAVETAMEIAKQHHERSREE